MAIENDMNFELPKKGTPERRKYDEKVQSLEKSMRFINSENMNITDVLKEIKKEFGIPAKTMRKMVKANIQANFNKQNQEHDAFAELYADTFGEGGNDVSTHRSADEIREELASREQEDRRLAAEEE